MISFFSDMMYLKPYIIYLIVSSQLLFSQLYRNAVSFFPFAIVSTFVSDHTHLVFVVCGL